MAALPQAVEGAETPRDLENTSEENAIGAARTYTAPPNTSYTAMPADSALPAAELSDCVLDVACPGHADALARSALFPGRGVRTGDIAIADRPTRAARLRRAADLGSAVAHRAIGRAYLDGKHDLLDITAVDDDLAARHLITSYQGGDGEAAFHLARMIDEGRATPTHSPDGLRRYAFDNGVVAAGIILLMDMQSRGEFDPELDRAVREARLQR